LVAILLIIGLSIPAAAPGSSCTMLFSGSLASLQMSPAGDWKIASPNCTVTSHSSGVTTGTFAGTYTSDGVSSRVSGTWSIVGSTEKLTASSTDFMMSIAVLQFPGLDSSVQGMLSATGSLPLLVVGTVGQITIG
jgi:hypothetical protein